MRWGGWVSVCDPPGKHSVENGEASLLYDVGLWCERRCFPCANECGSEAEVVRNDALGCCGGGGLNGVGMKDGVSGGRFQGGLG